jgi:hypothetical protein
MQLGPAARAARDRRNLGITSESTSISSVDMEKRYQLDKNAISFAQRTQGDSEK